MTNLVEGTWKYTFKDQKMEWSPSMYNIFKQHDHALNLNELFQLVHPEDRMKWALAMNQVSLGIGPAEVDCVFVLTNGEELWVKKSVSAVVENGISVGLEGICQLLHQSQAS